MKNDLDLVCHAHQDFQLILAQIVGDGHEFFADRQLVTIFCAPNYCSEFDDAGATMSIDESFICSFQILKSLERRNVSL
ncbi:hypothetical protein Nepgr_013026 [Nepenthes gracilis]|uniref:protein-serine/threonine phosphatase n=1 Tax=Nepenthes gracilis TaxID=150966 RepID=A0AAD3SI44_NEPGR|nr:hypothetical protein Nepgr_013026 [Nepenthes gracilis]